MFTDLFSKPLDVDLSKKKILIIEDFFAFRSTLKKMLRSLGVKEISDAATGEDALKEMTKRKFDIILCDHNLGPGKNGQQVLEEARVRDYITCSTVFMMITAENTIDVFMGSLEYQADDYLIKPITKGTLEKKITDWVKKKEGLIDIEKAQAKKDYDAVIALCNERIEKNPKNISELLKVKGDTLIRKGNYADAAAFYREVLSRGNLPWASLGLGRAKYHLGEYEEARRIFEGIIKKNEKIVPAHDMLAGVHEKTGDLKKAQEVLEKAVRISPRAILRQKALGKISYRNKDLMTAEQAFKEAVKQGKNSVLKSPADYTGLAKVLIEKDTPEEGLGILQEAGKEFPDSAEAAVQISVTEGFAFKKMNREEDARNSVRKAAELSAKLSASLPVEAEMDLARALYMTGDEQKGKEVVRHLVQNYQDNQDVIGTVRDMYEGMNRADEGGQIIKTALGDIVKMNNEGVKLVREGKYGTAIEFFEKAAERLPANKIINANAAHAVMLFIKQNGATKQLMQKSKKYLEAVRASDPTYGRVKELTDLLQNLSRED